MEEMAKWYATEMFMENALKELQSARRGCPDEGKAKELLELEITLCGIASNCPNFMAAQYELEGGEAGVDTLTPLA